MRRLAQVSVPLAAAKGHLYNKFAERRSCQRGLQQGRGHIGLRESLRGAVHELAIELVVQRMRTEGSSLWRRAGARATRTPSSASGNAMHHVLVSETSCHCLRCLQPPVPCCDPARERVSTAIPCDPHTTLTPKIMYIALYRTLRLLLPLAPATCRPGMPGSEWYARDGCVQAVGHGALHEESGRTLK